MITLIYQNNNQKIIIILEHQLKLHTAKLCLFYEKISLKHNIKIEK